MSDNDKKPDNITHESFTTFEHLQNLVGMFDNPLARQKMNSDQLEVIKLAREHIISSLLT